MKIKPDSIEWGGPDGDWFWIYWWNWLPPNLRYVGYAQGWYDGPHSSLGWWFGNISWRLPWTKHNGRKDWSISARQS